MKESVILRVVEAFFIGMSAFIVVYLLGALAFWDFTWPAMSSETVDIGVVRLIWGASWVVTGFVSILGDSIFEMEKITHDT